SINAYLAMQKKFIENIVKHGATLEAVAFKNLFILAILLITLLTITLLNSYFIARSITNPLSILTACLMKLAKQDTNFPTPLKGRQDEIGQIAGTLDIFKDNINKVKELNKQELKNAEENERKIKAEMLLIADRLDEEVQESVRALQERTSHMIKIVSQMVNSIKIVNDNVDEVVQGSKE